MVCGFGKVVATDIQPVLDDVLRVNIEANTAVVLSSKEKEKENEKEKPVVPTVIEVRELDWVEFQESKAEEKEEAYDLLTTADTIYEPSLITPLLTTITKLNAKRVLLAIEVRDNEVVEHAKRVAQEMGFGVMKVRQGKMAALMKGAGWGWGKEEWEGVEIWELKRGRKGLGK